MTGQLVLFVGRNCPACGPAKKIVEKIAAAHGLILTLRNAQEFRQQAALYRIESVPALVFLQPEKSPRITTKLGSAAALDRWINAIA